MKNYLETIKHHINSGKIYRILFLGDSITSTEWVHPNWREILEYVVKEELTKQLDDWKLPSWKIRTINSGMDGSTSQDLLDNFEDMVENYKPELVIYIQSSNDRHSNITPKQAALNNKMLVEKINSTSAELILLTTTPSNNVDYITKIRSYINEFTQLLSDEITVDLFAQLQSFDLDKFFTFESLGNEEEGIEPGEIDYMHPNQLGNAYIAKIILENCFGINFDANKYILNTAAGKMFPTY